MEITAEEIEANKNNPEKLKHIVDLLTQVIELDKKKEITHRQLRWELTRQMQLKMPKFWLEDYNGMKLVKRFHTWNDEYELVFGKPSPHIYGNFIQDAKEWKWRQRKKYDTANRKMIAA